MGDTMGFPDCEGYLEKRRKYSKTGTMVQKGWTRYFCRLHNFYLQYF